MITDDLSGINEADVLEWQKDDYRRYQDYQKNPDNFIRLPSKYEIHDWEIMRSFCETIEDEKIQDELLNSISGRGAFRAFRICVERNDLLKLWYKYKEEAYLEIAKGWCEENDVEAVEG